MNILVLVSFYPDDQIKYQGIFFQDQVYALSSRHKITLVYPFVNYSVFNILPKYSLNEIRINDNLKEIRIEIWKSLPVYNQLNYLMLSQRIIKNICKKEKIDIIHGHFAYPISFLSYLLSKSLNIPYCITEHSSNFEKGFRTRIHRFLGLTGLKNANGLFASGELLAEYLGQLFKKEIKVLHNTINLNKFNLKQKSNDVPLNIGFLGVLNDDRKGFRSFAQSII